MKPSWDRERYHSDPEYRERYLAGSREEYQRNREARRRRWREKYYGDPEYRARVNKESSERVIQVGKRRRMELIKYLGGKCQICGFSDPRALCVHHPNGNNESLRKGSTWLRFREYWKQRDELQLLCMNCHTILHSEVS